ncbi:MazG-like family protein [Streptomyces lincolnensis]|uniref:MazG-like family protein n=1 Tax=Streptomyces lincolnensis TaxID=1915 RepID=UPI001E6126B3|nr:MazG-like family protein [Streptomyces lincolnensis]MCD7439407.1 MazG-like family protein [Streptomyces lincolnensis]
MTDRAALPDPSDTSSDASFGTSSDTSFGTPPDLWGSIDGLWAWLEANRPAGDDAQSLLMRMLKLSEEVGEVAQAVIGATGRNPRKGVTHTWEDVESELCDVVITALVALRTLTPDTHEVFTRHLARVTERSRPGGRTPPAPGPAGAGSWPGSPGRAGSGTAGG